MKGAQSMYSKPTSTPVNNIACRRRRDGSEVGFGWCDISGILNYYCFILNQQNYRKVA